MQRVFKNNPAFLSDEELVQSFVVRHADLDIVMNAIRDNTTESNQHVLVIGPRGIGKTTLVLRAVAEVRRDEKLNQKWYPIVFAEESYQVSTPGEFWLEAIHHLGVQSEDSRWQRVFEDLRKERDETRLHDRALAQLLDYADSINKRLLLVVENLNMLLGDLLSDEDAWTLRHTLQNEPRIMLLSSATSRFEQIDNGSKAMFEMFKPLDLKPLDEEECKNVWEAVSGVTVTDNRIRPIQILTGGNPRLVTIISTFGARMSFEELMDDMIRLVDEHTEYFKSLLDNLAATERKVYLALVERWDPSTARDVAHDARLDVNKTSSLLRRLVERGAVVVVEESPRLKLYQVAERMYNIYYLMRKRSGSMMRAKAVVQFMSSLYTPEELLGLSRKIASDACKLQLRNREDHYYAWGEIYERLPLPLKREMMQLAPMDFFDAHDTPETIKQLMYSSTQQEYFPSKEMSYEDKQIKDLLVQANKLSINLKTYLKAEELYRKVLEIDFENIEAMFKLSHLLIFKLEKYKEAEEVYQLLLKFDPDNKKIWNNFGNLLGLLKRYEEAEAAYRKSLAIDTNNTLVWINLGSLLCDELGKYDEAESAFRKALEIDPNSKKAWRNLGIVYVHLNRYKEAETSFRKALEIDPQNVDMWRQLGDFLSDKLNRYDEAESAYKKALEIDPGHILAWINLGSLLCDELGKYDEAESAFRKALEIDSNHSGIYNALAWSFYKSDKVGYEEKVELWAKKACEIEPKDLHIIHTYACILAYRYKCQLSLEQTDKMLTNVEFIKVHIDDMITLFTELAVSGCARESIELIENSPSAGLLEPMVVGLKLYLGEKVNVAVEIKEVGKDVVKKIEARKLERERNLAETVYAGSVERHL